MYNIKMDKYSQLSSPSFDWKENARSRLQLSKKALTEHSKVMTKLASGNAFIEPIFRGCNVFIQLSEMVRRGVMPILDSVNARFPERNFFATCIEEDLKAARISIRRLYKHGSHNYLFPDELEYVKYLIHNESCCCGECLTSFTVDIDSSCVRFCRFNPPVPLPEEYQLRINRFQEDQQQRLAETETETETEPETIDSAFLQLASMATEEHRGVQTRPEVEPPADSQERGPHIQVNNYGGIRVRATQQYIPFRPGIYLPMNSNNISGELIVDIPSNTPYQQFLSAENVRLGRVSVAFNLGYLNSIMEEVMALDFDDEVDENEVEIDFDDLQDVAVTMDIEAYNNAVDIVKPENEEKCPICIENLHTTDDLNLNSLCVRVKCCGNVFHDACLRHLLCDVGPCKCPMCRIDMRSFSEQS